MKKKQLFIFIVLLILIAGTAGALTWMKTHQRLGKPGIKATPIPGTVAMDIQLPQHVLEFESTNVPEPKVVSDYLPLDTSFVERRYFTPDGFGVSGTMILMGMDRTSIHRPEYCMLGQGWSLGPKTKVSLPIAGPKPYELPVMRWNVSTTAQTADGRKQTVGGVYVFWFVADNEQTTGNVQLQTYLVRDLLLSGVLQRWAYISYFAICMPGDEDATFTRMSKLIAASVPDFQLPPKIIQTDARH